MDFLNCIITDEFLVIKDEVPDQQLSLLSPPTTPPPPFYTLPCLPSTSRRRGSSSSLARATRSRPYPTHRKDLSITMSSSGYGTWNASGRSGHGRSHPSVERRSSDEASQPAYSLSQQYINVSIVNPSSWFGHHTQPPRRSHTSAACQMGRRNYDPFQAARV